MFKTRLISGIVLVALSILLITLGGDVLLLSIGAISLIGMYELYRVVNVHKSAIGAVGYVAAALYYCDLRFHFLPEPMIGVMALLVVLLFVYVFSYPKYDAKQVTTVFFGIFYVAVMLSYICQIRSLEHGLYLTYTIFICSWGCDTSAYCVGKLIGKHKMSPILSPKKSVEGGIGGVVGAALLGLIYFSIFKSKMGIAASEVWLLVAIVAIAAMISMVGDLAASAIKRNYDIKDYGKLIPGHGGILDRFDSMIITAPIIYYLALYLI